MRWLYNFIGRLYLMPLINAEIRKRFKANGRTTEYSYALSKIDQFATGKVLDIGSGKSSWPHLLSYSCGLDVTAIDRVIGYWSDYFNRHYKIVNDDITNSKLTDFFQFITCISTLEHIKDHNSAMVEINELLDLGGYLVLTFPYNEQIYFKNIYEHKDAGYGKDKKFVTQVYSRSQIDYWLHLTQLKIVDQVYYKVFTGEFWTFGDPIKPIQVEKNELHHLTCILMQKL